LVVTSQSEKTTETAEVNYIFFIIYFDDMWGCERLLSSLALIQANVRIGQDERNSLQLIENVHVNHVSDVKTSKNLIKFQMHKKNNQTVF